MEVYCRFKSAKDYDSVPIDWHYTTVSDLKEYILKRKCSGKRSKSCYDNLVLTNADTDEEYLDGQTLIPKNACVIIRRLPRCSFLPIVINPPVTGDDEEDNLLAENKLEEGVFMYPSESEWEEFWNVMSPPEIAPVQDASPTDSTLGAVRGFGRGGMGRRSGSYGFGRGALLDQMKPPSSYICRRCKVPGHFIQHCPTNGDPAFDLKRTRPPTGIPQSMLMATPDGSYALPNGDFAALKPSEAAFEKEIQGIPSTRSVADLPAELYCPLCKAVMKDAVLASKCCLDSFCDKCIRDYIISNSLCICGAKNVLADDLIPNKTVRDTIIRILESSNCSGTYSGSAFKAQVMESTRGVQLKIQSSTLSEASKGIVPALKSVGNTKTEGMTEALQVQVANLMQKTLGAVTLGKDAEVSGAAKEPGPLMGSLVTNEEMQQKPILGKTEKKRKTFSDLQSRPHDSAAENFMMPSEASGYSPYWNVMQPRFDGLGQPYCGQMPFIDFGLGPAFPIWGTFHHDLSGAQAYMSREESGALETIKKQKRGPERSGGSIDLSSDKTFSRDMIGKEKHDDDHHAEHTSQPMKKVRLHEHRSELVSSTRLPIVPETVYLPPQSLSSSLMARITFPESESTAFKKRKLGRSSAAVNGSSHHRSHITISNKYHEDHHKTTVAVSKNSYKYYADHHNYGSSHNDRHFKWMPTKFESSPTPASKEGRHSSRGWREKGVVATSIGRLSVH